MLLVALTAALLALQAHGKQININPISQDALVPLSPTEAHKTVVKTAEDEEAPTNASNATAEPEPVHFDAVLPHADNSSDHFGPSELVVSKLHDLEAAKKSGLLSQQEHDATKMALLSSIAPKQPEPMVNVLQGAADTEGTAAAELPQTDAAAEEGAAPDAPTAETAPAAAAAAQEAETAPAPAPAAAQEAETAPAAAQEAETAPAATTSEATAAAPAGETAVPAATGSVAQEQPGETTGQAATSATADKAELTQPAFLVQMKEYLPRTMYDMVTAGLRILGGYPRT